MLVAIEDCTKLFISVERTAPVSFCLNSVTHESNSNLSGLAVLPGTSIINMMKAYWYLDHAIVGSNTPKPRMKHREVLDSGFTKVKGSGYTQTACSCAGPPAFILERKWGIRLSWCDSNKRVMSLSFKLRGSYRVMVMRYCLLRRWLSVLISPCLLSLCFFLLTIFSFYFFQTYVLRLQVSVRLGVG